MDEGNDKVLRLTDEGMLKILTSQIVGLLRHKNQQESECVPLNRLQSLFSRKYGMPLVPNHYNCDDIEKLMKKLPHVVTVSIVLCYVFTGHYLLPITSVKYTGCF